MVFRQEVLCREAQGKDAKTLSIFMAQVAKESDFLAMDEDGLPISEKDLAAILDSWYHSVDQLCLLAMLNQEVIGVLTVRTPSPAKISHIGDVFLAVSKTYWGKGIGRILLEEMLTWVHEEKILARLELTVQIRNQAAVHLYETVGFQIEGTQKRGAKSKEGDWLDLYYMGQLIEIDGDR